MDIEKKIKEMEESCLRLVSKETETIKEDIREEIETQMKSELNEYHQRKQWNFNKTIQKLEKEYMKEIFDYQNKCKKDILIAKQEIDSNLKQLVIIKLIQFTEEEGYKEFLQDCIDKVLENADEYDNICIGLTQKDLNRFSNSLRNDNRIQYFEIDNKYIGGCVLNSDGLYIDNTLYNSLDEKMKEIKE